MNLTIHTDGGARGNPGPAAIGVVIESSDNSHQTTVNTQLKTEDRRLKTLAAFGRKIGETTNNVAEYTAVIEALKYVQSNNELRITNNDSIQFFLDSLLVVNQLKGIFKVKEAHLRELLMGIRVLEREVGGTITYTHVRREQNKEADRMVNQALDN